MKLQKESYLVDGRYPIIDQSQQEIAGWSDDELAVVRPPKPLVIFGDHTCSVKLVKQPFVQGADGIKIIETNYSLLPAFLFNFLKVNPLETDGYKRHFTDLKRKIIPLPPLAIQQEIIAEIEGYQKIIDGARQVVENYQPRINVQPDWPLVKFSDVVFFQEGPGIRNWQFTTSGVKLLNVKNIVGDRVVLDNSDKYVSTDEVSAKYSHFLVEDGDIILASSGATYGKNAVFKDPGFPVMVNTSNIRLHPKDATRILQGYIKIFLDSPYFKAQIDKLITGAAQPNFGPSHLKQIQMPLPDLETQRAIVAEIEAEQALVNANKQLITCFEAKIKTTINRVWGEAS